MSYLESFLFCPRCGEKFSQRKTWCWVCGKCGFEFYGVPKPTAGVMLVDEKGEILMVKRSIEPGKGKYTFPGGFVNEGETLEEAVVRETKEELDVDIDINDLEYICSGVHDYLFQDVNYELIAAIFKGKIDSGAKITVAEDAAAYKFFKPRAITPGILAFPTVHQPAIDKLKS